MAGTFTQLQIHFVFAVKGRESLIKENFRVDVEQYITGIVHAREHKLLAIYCMPDHIHILVGKRPRQSESDLMRDIKSNSSKFINEQNWVPSGFAWQSGYGAFSCAQSQIDRVISYIRNQPQHHRHKKFKEEYLHMLNRFGVKYETKDLFEWIEGD